MSCAAITKLLLASSCLAKRLSLTKEAAPIDSVLSRLFVAYFICWRCSGAAYGTCLPFILFPITLSIGTEYSVKTAITGMVSIENNVSNAAARLINTSISIQDGKVSTLLIAPKSITQYLGFLIKASFSFDKKVSRFT